MKWTRSRAVIFAIALVVRLIPGALTFGTSDLANCFRNTAYLLAGHDADVPYLPGVEVLLRDGGMLAWQAPMPAALGYKLIPILCDALLALLLAGAVSPLAGLLYAVNPIGVMVTSMHGQWDSITLLFLAAAVVMSESTSERRNAAVGAFWLLSVVVKPYTLPLLPLLCDRRDWRRSLWTIAGAAGAGVVYLLILIVTARLPTWEHLKDVSQYAASGLRIFGLPLQAGRVPLLAALIVVFALYFRGRLGRRTAVLLYFVFAIALSNLAAQYLCWIVPFALLAGRTRFLALYTLVAGGFLAFYYRAPLLEISNIVALGAYGMLRPFASLTPSAFANAGLLRLIGNFAIPLLCLAYGVFTIVRREEEAATEDRAVAPAYAALILIALVTFWAALLPAVDAMAFTHAMRQRIATQYDVMLYEGPLVNTAVALTWIPITMAKGQAHRWWNASTLLLLWTAASAFATFRLGRHP